MRTVFHLPDWLQELRQDFARLEGTGFSQMQVLVEPGSPAVSVVIPSGSDFNDLMLTLCSLQQLRGSGQTDAGGAALEWIVVDTGLSMTGRSVLQSLGYRIIRSEAAGGLEKARQEGLEAARGRYVLSADPGSAYPPGWTERFVKILREEPEVSCVYGPHSFVPEGTMQRIGLGIYRFLSTPFQSWRSVSRECSMVFGFNMGFRRMDALRVGGYPNGEQIDRDEKRESEDGRLALRLSRFGLLRQVDDESSRVWIKPGRLAREGGILTTIVKRVIRELNWSSPRRKHIVAD